MQPLGVLLVLGACLFAAFYRVYNKGAAAEFTAFERSYFVIGLCAVVFAVVALVGVRGDLAPFAAAAAQQKICHGHHFSQRVLLCGCQYSGKLQRIRVAYGNFFQSG